MTELDFVELTNTCFACPSQWEGTLGDGRTVYIRFRWGYLSVSVSPPPVGDYTPSMSDAVSGEEIFGKRVSDGLDGMIDILEVAKELQSANFTVKLP